MRFLFVITIIFISKLIFSQSKILSKEDTLIGSNTSYRAWWDVTHYTISVKPDYNTKSIFGNTIITYKVICDSLPFIMQIDLQDPLQVDSVFINRVKFTNYKRENNRWMMSLTSQKKKHGAYDSIILSR